MSVNVSRSSDYEAQANRLRADMGSTIDQLRVNLTPSHLASEAASRAGVADLSFSGAFDFAGKRHPVPTAIIGLGLALWTLSAFRGRARGATLASLSSPLTKSSSSLVNSATRCFGNAPRRKGKNLSARPKRKSYPERKNYRTKLNGGLRTSSLAFPGEAEPSRLSPPLFRSGLPLCSKVYCADVNDSPQSPTRRELGGLLRNVVRRSTENETPAESASNSGLPDGGGYRRLLAPRQDHDFIIRVLKRHSRIIVS